MTQRRDFLKQASVLAASSFAVGALDARDLEAQAPQAQNTWDMSWTAKVTGKYRMAFDSPEINGGNVFHQARSFLSGYNATYGLGDADLTAVMILRHKGVPMACGDAIWEDGAIGTTAELKDPVTGESTKRNPFINVPAGAPYALTWADGAMDTLIKRGVIVLACDLALGGLAGQVAERRKIPRQDARKLVLDNLVPGVIRMPSGIFATSHAQQLGCGVLSAT
jgi:hypothetical protein